jgi:hypothetical protein
MSQRKIREFVVDITIKDNDIGVTFLRLADLEAKAEGIGEIETEAREGKGPGRDVFVATVQWILGTPDAGVAFEGLQTHELAVTGEADNVVPESEQASAESRALEPGFESGDLRTLTSPIYSRKTDDDHEIPAPDARMTVLLMSACLMSPRGLASSSFGQRNDGSHGYGGTNNGGGADHDGSHPALFGGCDGHAGGLRCRHSGGMRRLSCSRSYWLLRSRLLLGGWKRRSFGLSLRFVRYRRALLRRRRSLLLGKQL